MQAWVQAWVAPRPRVTLLVVGVQYTDAKLLRVMRSSCGMDVHRVEI